MPTQSKMEEKMNDKKRPIAKIRDGWLEAAVWENTTKDGKTYHVVSIQAGYKTEQGIRNRSTFTVDELLKVAELAKKARERALGLRRLSRVE